MPPTLTCPHCAHVIPLTRVRYLKTPLGRHLCPHCGRRSRSAHTMRYHLANLLNVLVVFGIPYWFLMLPHRGDPGHWLLVIPSLVAGFEIDRWLSASLRPVVALGAGAHDHAPPPDEDRPLKPFDPDNPYAAPTTDVVGPKRDS